MSNTDSCKNMIALVAPISNKVCNTKKTTRITRSRRALGVVIIS